MPIQALIFDFDGLIFDSETPDYQSWREMYLSFGVELPLDIWQQNIGSVDFFNPFTYLEGLVGRPLDRQAIHTARKQRDHALLAQQTIMPGVLEYLAEAEALGLRIGIASSSRRNWVEGHLKSLGLNGRFQAICCRDDVNDRAKPDPAVYLTVTEQLGVPPHLSLALEDSPNGATAAKAAGLWCVVVPNDMTRDLSFPPVDWRLSSLAETPLTKLLAELSKRQSANLPAT